MSRVFATQIPVQKSTSLEDIILLTKEWLSNSPHNKLSVESIQFDQENPFVKQEITTELITYETNKITGGVVKVTREVEDSSWITEIGFSKSSNDNTIAVVNSINTPIGKKPPQTKKPRIIDEIVSKKLPHYDSIFAVSDEPHEMTLQDLSFFTPILLGEETTQLPIVYVSKSKGFKQPVIPFFLAKKLAGIAHVVAEDSVETSYRLSEIVPHCPYQGTIGIIWPKNTYIEKIDPKVLHQRAISSLIKKENRFYSPREINWAKEDIISRRIMGGLKHISIPDALRYDGARRINKREQLSQKIYNLTQKTSSDNSEELKEALETSNELLGIQDKEISDLETAKFDLEQKLLVYESHTNQKESDRTMYQDDPKNQLYEGEKLEIIKHALENESRIVLENSRRAKLIKDMLSEDNFPQTQREEILGELKDIFSSYQRLDTKTSKRLKDIGFVVEDDGKHYKLRPENSKEHVVFAKTPSDYRAGQNIYTEIKKALF